ncbi:MAG: Fic family protein [Candidatus Dormibacteria bacterium]
MVDGNQPTNTLFETPDLDDAELSVLAEIDRLRTKLRWQLNEPRRWVGSLRRMQFARAVQGSNSIEGYEAALDDAAAIDLGEEPLDADEETHLALKGYRDAMTYVLQLAGEDDFSYSEQLIKSLHFMMTNHDLKCRPGLWRAGSIYVRNDETGEVVYEGPDVDQVPKLMRRLVERLNDGGDAPSMIRGAMAHLNLVMIHPFRDGNGRMGRCLQTLVLAREKILSPHFCSVEEYLGRNTDNYYAVLGRVGAGAWHPERDARPWIRFILAAHLRQARTLLRRVKETEQLWDRLERRVKQLGLPERTVPVLWDAAMGYRVRNATYRAIFNESPEEAMSEVVASRDLRQLVDVGLLVPKGEKRGRFYLPSRELFAMRQEIIKARDRRDDSDPFEQPGA